MQKPSYIFLFLLAAAIAAIVVIGYGGGQNLTPLHIATGGTAGRGKQLIIEKRCGSCHIIPGIKEAKGLVGPPLSFFARRTYIAGQLPNTPENLTTWVQTPQSVNPLTAMPNLGLSDQQARDVAAYLYTLQ
jgi:cytochrome c